MSKVTSRTIKEACDRAERFGKSIQLDTLMDMKDHETAKSILENVYFIGYTDAKNLNGDWNNPIPTWGDFKHMITSWWKWIMNIPPYALSRCGRVGNRRIVVFIRRDINFLLDELLEHTNCSVSRNGWKSILAYKLQDKYVRRGLIKSFNIVNNDPKSYKCVWISQEGLDGYVDIYLRNCNEVVRINFEMKDIV